LFSRVRCEAKNSKRRQENGKRREQLSELSSQFDGPEVVAKITIAHELIAKWVFWIKFFENRPNDTHALLYLIFVR